MVAFPHETRLKRSLTRISGTLAGRTFPHHISNVYRLTHRYEIIARHTLNAFVEKAYIAKGMSDNVHSRLDVQQLATLFAVLALGASHNLELSPDDQIAEDYCESARNCLVKGNFMTHSTLAGVQTLVISNSSISIPSSRPVSDGSLPATDRQGT